MKINNKQIVKLYNGGKSTYEIAEKYDTYPNKIRRILIKEGVELRDKSKAQSTAIKTGRHKHPTKGTERDVETRIKISGSMVDYFSNLSDEERQKIVDKQTELWYNRPQSERDEFIRVGNEAIRKSREEGSKLEHLVLDELHEKKLGPIFHDNNILPGRKLEVDINLPTRRIAIEVDGPSHFSPIWGEEKLKKQQQFDNDKNALLTKNGFKVIRIQCELDVVPLAKEIDLKETLLKEINKPHQPKVVKIKV